MVYDPNMVDERTVRDFMNRMRLPNAKYALISTLVNMSDAGRKLEQSGRLASVSAPTLIIWGEEDRVIPIQYSQGFRQAIPNNTFVTIGESGHVPYVERPVLFIGNVHRWWNNSRRIRGGESARRR